MTGRFDHVIVGAGSAGACLAARLSEDPARRVLLLEAGPDHRSADTPERLAGPDFFAALEEPGRTWPHLVARRTAHQEPRLYARGRGAGGSSSVNARLAIRGLPEDYDRWVELGAPGWGWADLEPVFATLPVPRRPLPPERFGAVDRALVEAALAAGHPYAPDHDAAGAMGWSPVRLTVDEQGRRRSTNDVYLEPARGRANFVVRGDALVDRVLLDGRRAVGVRLAGGEEIDAAEVVVSAGAIHSPALLLRSGVDRPGIGRNLKDHPSAQAVLLLGEEHRAAVGRAEPFGVVLRWWSGNGEHGADLQLLAFNHLGPGADMGLLMCALMHVQSTGTVMLASANPYDDPAVDFAMLTDGRDLARLRLATRHLMALAGHDAFTRIASRIVMDAAGTPPSALVDDDDLDAWLLANVGDYVHACGTCRMGPPDDELAVVDPQLRVIGYAGLRVADASVMPDLPRANTHLTTVVIGERAASLIRSGT